MIFAPAPQADEETLFSRANEYLRCGSVGQARDIYEAVMARRPDHLRCTRHLLSVLRHQNEWSAARALALGALARHPGDIEFRLALAACALGERHAAEALPIAEAILADRPDMAEAYFLLGTALNMLGQPEAAVDAQLSAIALEPDHAAAHLNLANALADLDRTGEALECCLGAIAINPMLIEAHVSLGYIYTRLCRPDLAIAACRQALALSPGHVQAHWNLGIAALLAGDWILGWKQYEWRKRPELYAAHFRIPRGEEWRGGDLAGRTLTVCSEQGLGDAIQLARYLPLLVRRGAGIILSCAAPLMPLFHSHPDLMAVIDRAAPLQQADLWVDQMSLPGIFGTTPFNVPAADGYLNADAVRTDRWRAMLPAGPKVGLVWGGNPLHSNDRRRSLPHGAIEKLLGLKGIRLISLQVGRPMPPSSSAIVHDAAPLLSDFAETAACIANLDLVIAVDTSTAHLAGALGRDVWLMLPFAPDWRWLLNTRETPWYSSMKLFRQRHENDWDHVIESVSAALRDRFA